MPEDRDQEQCPHNKEGAGPPPHGHRAPPGASAGAVPIELESARLPPVGRMTKSLSHSPHESLEDRPRVARAGVSGASRSPFQLVCTTQAEVVERFRLSDPVSGLAATTPTGHAYGDTKGEAIADRSRSAVGVGWPLGGRPGRARPAEEPGSPHPSGGVGTVPLGRALPDRRHALPGPDGRRSRRRRSGRAGRPGRHHPAAGDHVVTSFLPPCGHCPSCIQGHQNLCDMGMHIADGWQVTDQTARHHARGIDLRLFCMVGDLCPAHHRARAVVHQDRRRPPAGPGLPGGVWREHRLGLRRAPGPGSAGRDVAVIGVGGVGSAAVQGARLAGARRIFAIDPVGVQAGAGAADSGRPTRLPASRRPSRSSKS